MTGNEGNDSKCQEIVTKSNVQNETGKKSFNDEIQLFEKTQFPAMKSDFLDRESTLAVKKCLNISGPIFYDPFKIM